MISDEYLDYLRSALPYGSQVKIAQKLRLTDKHVNRVLAGEHENSDVLTEAVAIINEVCRQRKELQDCIQHHQRLEAIENEHHPSTIKHLYDVHEAAKFLGVTEEWVRILHRKGKLNCQRSGNCLKVSITELMRYKTAH